MASIQIHEIETPIEDLSYDEAVNINGGGLFDTLGDFYDTVRTLVTETYAFCAENGAEDPAGCAQRLLRDIFYGPGPADEPMV